MFGIEFDVMKIKNQLVPEAKKIIKEKEKNIDNFARINPFQLDSNLTNISWVVPTYENFEFIINKIKEINPQNIIELGAGSGLFAKYLNQNINCNYIGYKKNKYDCDDLNFCKKIKLIDSFSEIDFSGKDTYLLFWPPYANDFAYNVLKKFLKNKDAKYLFYIGEDEGGCTANDDFFKLIEKAEKENKIKIDYYELPLTRPITYESLWIIRKNKEEI